MAPSPEELASMAWHNYRRGVEEIRKAIEAAKAEEREACAKVAFGISKASLTEEGSRTGYEIMDAIRARGTP